MFPLVTDVTAVSIWFAVGWLVWTLLFIAWESIALSNKRNGDTLSETTRWLFRVKTSKIGRTLFLLIWSAFAVWFAVHILTGEF